MSDRVTLVFLRPHGPTRRIMARRPPRIVRLEWGSDQDRTNPKLAAEALLEPIVRRLSRTRDFAVSWAEKPARARRNKSPSVDFSGSSSRNEAKKSPLVDFFRLTRCHSPTRAGHQSWRLPSN